MMCLTAPMNQTLEATRTTVVYDEFSLKLYFLAKDVLKEAVHISVTVQPGMTVSVFRSPAHFDLNAARLHGSVDASIDARLTRAPLSSEPSEGGRCCRLESDGQRPASGSRFGTSGRRFR